MESPRLSRTDFAAVMAYLAAGMGKPVPAETAEVYYDLLGDLPLPALQAAARLVLLQHHYATFPPVALLRQEAVKVMAGAEGVMAGAEAWEIVRRLIARYGWSGGRQAFEQMPPLVRRAADCLGWTEMCDSTQPEVCRVQFMRAFDAIAAGQRREAMLPAPLRESIAALGFSDDLKRIGKEPWASG